LVKVLASTGHGPPSWKIILKPQGVKGAAKMVSVIASIRVKEGRMPEFIEKFKSNIPNVLGEEGCLEYLPTVDIPTGMPPQELDKDVVTIIEKWRSLEALQAHASAPHMLAYQKAVKGLVDKVSLKVLAEA
jgi:quinol monooxygenase YgiN